MAEEGSVSSVRSRNMAAIRGKDTAPELAVRRILHAMGLRFRMHRKDLPGRPDIVLPKHRTVVFVHGCFWHRHEGCRYTTTPKTRQEFWQSKFADNVERDSRNSTDLQQLGWRVIVVWECELRQPSDLKERLKGLFPQLDQKR
jgi:DNA mismatch endonuclease (patch repair protein)